MSIVAETAILNIKLSDSPTALKGIAVFNMVQATISYTISFIKQEARQLVKKGILSRQQPIYTLCKYIPPREWGNIELELEHNDFLLRDRICDLLGREDWYDE